jgi:hypothetical protein
MKYLIALVALVGLTSCRPYEPQVFEVVENSETAYVIPLDSDSGDQISFDSEEYLESRKVATKRIQVPHRWVKTGYTWLSGEHMASIRVITVDRTPVTREWVAGNGGTNADKDEAIWIESNDSIGFSVGFTATGKVEETDTSKFLYQYRSRSLADVMDTEVRARIQSVAADQAATADMDLLRTQKNEIISAIRTDVIPYFAEFGITITTVGMFGGFTYEEPRIQQSINETFIAQQEKVVAAALLVAQVDKNAIIELEANAIAEKARRIASGEADALRMVNEATAEVQGNPVFLEMKRIDLEMLRAEQWNGAYPQWYMSSGGNGNTPEFLMQVPSPPK